MNVIFLHLECAHRTLEIATLGDTHLILCMNPPLEDSLLEAVDDIIFLFLCVASAQNKTGIQWLLYLMSKWSWPRTSWSGRMEYNGCRHNYMARQNYNVVGTKKISLASVIDFFKVCSEALPMSPQHFLL